MNNAKRIKLSHPTRATTNINNNNNNNNNYYNPECCKELRHYLIDSSQFGSATWHKHFTLAYNKMILNLSCRHFYMHASDTCATAAAYSFIGFVFDRFLQADRVLYHGRVFKESRHTLNKRKYALVVLDEYKASAYWSNQFRENVESRHDVPIVIISSEPPPPAIYLNNNYTIVNCDSTFVHECEHFTNAECMYLANNNNSNIGAAAAAAVGGADDDIVVAAGDFVASDFSSDDSSSSSSPVTRQQVEQISDAIYFSS